MLFLSEKLAEYLTCQFSCFLCSSQHHHNVKCDDNRAQLRELAEARANVAERLLLFFLRLWKFPNVRFGPYIWKDFLSLFFSPSSSFPCLIHSPLKIPSHSGHGWCEADGFCSAQPRAGCSLPTMVTIHEECGERWECRRAELGKDTVIFTITGGRFQLWRGPGGKWSHVEGQGKTTGQVEAGASVTIES